MQHLFGEHLGARHLIIGIFLIGFCSSSWIVKSGDGIKVSSLIQSPDFTIGSRDYFIRMQTLPPAPGLKKYGFVQIPLLRVDGELFLNRPIALPSSLVSGNTSLVLRGRVLPTAQTGWLEVKINSHMIGRKLIHPNDRIDWKLPLNIKTNRTRVDLSVLDPSENKNTLPIHNTQFELISNSNPKIDILPLEQIKKHCAQQRNVTECHIKVDHAYALQLPVFYYPEILTVLLDNQAIDYQGTFYQNTLFEKKNKHFDPVHDTHPYIMTTILIPPGQHSITVKNNGVLWANLISLITWSIVIVMLSYLLMVSLLLKHLHRDYDDSQSM